MSGGVGVEGFIASGRVVKPTCVIFECGMTDGSVVVPGGVSIKGLLAHGSVGITGGVV